MSEAEQVRTLPPLAEAEMIARHVAALNPWVQVLLTEYEAYQAALAAAGPVVEAAREYLDELESPAPDYTMRKILRDRLAARVRAHTDTTTEKG